MNGLMKSEKFLVKSLTLLGLGAITLTGCASMDMAECQTADWETIGYQDGADGRPSEDISRHRKACAKHNVTPILAHYVEGWNDGVLRYCTPQNGFSAGSSGRAYDGVCPADVEDEFLAAFGDGRELHTLRTNVQQISHRISRDERRLVKIEDSILHKEARLIGSGGTPEERAHLIADLRSLSEEKGQLEQAVLDMEHELGRAEVELEHYRSDIAYEYGL